MNPVAGALSVIALILLSHAIRLAIMRRTLDKQHKALQEHRAALLDLAKVVGEVIEGWDESDKRVGTLLAAVKRMQGDD